MAKTMREAMAELGRDVERWKAEIDQLKADGQRGHDDIVERIQDWIAEADNILDRWDAKPMRGTTGF